jgi:hypothetical protein
LFSLPSFSRRGGTEGDGVVLQRASTTRCCAGSHPAHDVGRPCSIRRLEREEFYESRASPACACGAFPGSDPQQGGAPLPPSNAPPGAGYVKESSEFSLAESMNNPTAWRAKRDGVVKRLLLQGSSRLSRFGSHVRRAANSALRLVVHQAPGIGRNTHLHPTRVGSHARSAANSSVRFVV